MNYLKKIGPAIVGIAFCLCLFSVAGYAQYGRSGSYQNRDYYRQQQQYRNWVRQQRIQNRYNQNRYYQNRYNQNRYYGNGRISPQEARRLYRQRQRLYNTTSRFYRDGYLNSREQRKLQKRYNKYRRNAYRDRRDW
ncbi:MAG TPA: hypothetical protein VF556_06490 [Pyrinomonadaceae bacterium]|jgi:hypothetical protein